MNRLREIAKFACGAIAFHALIHAYLWWSDTNLTVFGVRQSPAWNIAAAILSAVLSLALGIYAWRPDRPRVW